MKLSRQTLLASLLAIALIILLGASHTNTAASQAATAAHPFQELIEQSQKEKKGLTFFIKGQTIGGGVVRLIGNEAVEVRNQNYSRVIIRLDQVDAAAIN